MHAISLDTVNRRIDNRRVKLRFLSIFLVFVACSAAAQPADHSSLGVLIAPSRTVSVSKELRAALPKNVAIRLVRKTMLSPNGEQVIIYEAGDEYIPHSHVAILKDGKRVADLNLKQIFKHGALGEMYTLFQAAEFHRGDERRAFVAAFRNVGDGSGTVFVVVTESAGHYKVWKKATIQGPFKLPRSGEMEVWQARDSPGGEIDCVWCRHYYEVEFLKWVDGTLTRTRSIRTERPLDPNVIADKPIVIER